MTDAPTFTLSADVRAVYDRLVRAKVGDTITYSELSGMVRREIQGKDRYVLASALRKCIGDGVAFGVVRNVGVTRLTDTEIVKDSDNGLPRIRAVARKYAKRAMCIADFAALSAEQRTRHNAMVSVYGAIAHLSTEKVAKKIEGKVSTAKQALALADTLAAFR